MSETSRQRAWWHPLSLLILTGCLLFSHAAGGIGMLVSSTPGSWYNSLNKPLGTPPGVVFGIVWAILYSLIGLALFIFIRNAHTDHLSKGLFLFAVQWGLNAFWTPLFFGLQRPVWALLDLAVLLLAIFLTLKIFVCESRWAGLLLVPYLAWSLYATYLNVSFVFLNFL